MGLAKLFNYINLQNYKYNFNPYYICKEINQLSNNITIEVPWNYDHFKAIEYLKNHYDLHWDTLTSNEKKNICFIVRQLNVRNLNHFDNQPLYSLSKFLQMAVISGQWNTTYVELNRFKNPFYFISAFHLHKIEEQIQLIENMSNCNKFDSKIKALFDN
jgi:hypothetical protein